MNDNENDAFEPIYLSIGSNDLSINDDDTVYDKWSVVDHETYIPTVKTKNKLPSNSQEIPQMHACRYQTTLLSNIMKNILPHYVR